MPDPVGRRKARLLALIFIAAAAVVAWSFLRGEPAGRRCARIAVEERDRRLRAAATAVGPDTRGEVAALPRPADSVWYQQNCNEDKPR